MCLNPLGKEVVFAELVDKGGTTSSILKGSNGPHLAQLLNEPAEGGGVQGYES